MRQMQTSITIETGAQGLYEITDRVRRWVGEQSIATGMLTVFCRHTSASLIIQENADRNVAHDLHEYFCRIVPENEPWYRHNDEGPDDMPAHIKSALTNVSVNIPVASARLLMGTWQGLFLFEHRTGVHSRTVVLHLLGE